MSAQPISVEPTVPEISTSGDVTDMETSPSIKPLAGLVSFGGRNDAKLILSPEALKKVTRKSLSPSTAKSMSGCTASWAIDKLLPRSEDPFGAAELGTAGHRVFELIFALSPEERTTERAMQLVANLQNDTSGGVAIPSDPEQLDMWHNRVSSLVTGLWAIENPRTIEVVGVELKVENVLVAGVPILGYIDRLRLGPEGTVVGDYKTGAKVPNKRYGDDHGDQLRTYSEALANTKGYDRPVGAEVLYTQCEQIDVVDMNKSAMEKTLEKFARAWDTHNTLTSAGEFPTKVTALCGWCPAVDVCPSAQREGKVARKEGMSPGALLGIGETGTVVSINAKSKKTEAVETSPAPSIGSTAPIANNTSAHEFKDRGTTPMNDNEGKETPMYEPKPWEETNEDGSLNLASYAATGAFGVVELAVDTLHASAARVTSETVLAFSQTLKEIIDAVFERLGNKETASLQAGRHARLRGALRTSLETMPPPFGEDTETWDNWVRLSKKRTLNVARTAISLWETDEAPVRPWAIFASDYTPAETVDVES
jgi:putative RecB family exonuclease